MFALSFVFATHNPFALGGTRLSFDQSHSWMCMITSRPCNCAESDVDRCIDVGLPHGKQWLVIFHCHDKKLAVIFWQNQANIFLSFRCEFVQQSNTERAMLFLSIVFCQNWRSDAPTSAARKPGAPVRPSNFEE